MKAKLFHKTLRIFLYYAIVLFVIAAPFFYFVIQQLYQNEADDTLRLHKNEFKINVLPGFSEIDVVNWNKFNRNSQLTKINTFQRDTFFTTSYYDSLEGELEPYRELNSTVSINGNKYLFSSRFNLVENEDIIRNIFLLFLGILVLLTLGFLFITRMLSISLWKPFYTILGQIESFEIDKNFKYENTATHIQEFHRLNETVKKLIDKNVAIYQNQKEFIENAAHELQTPLAVFKAKVDTLLQDPSLSEEQFKIIDTIIDNIDKLIRINKNLLLLSRIENDSYQQIESCSIRESLEKSLTFFSEQAEAKNIRINSNIEEDVLVRTNQVLLDILISNLFLNAIKHNAENGFIIITLTYKTLTFKNSSPYKALRKQNLFTRFSRHNINENSTGLGLSIIKKIVDTYQWSIQYDYLEGLHAFEIRF